MRRPGFLLVLGVGLLPGSGFLPAAVATADDDPRSRVIVSSDCRTDTERREITLFANGTIRLREGVGATRQMRLAELGGAEAEAYVERLREIRFDDLAPQLEGLEGDWVESCTLRIELPGEPAREFVYGRYDTLPLGWKHVLLLVDDLILELENARLADGRARNYEPEIGDILIRRSDGAAFEVLGFTLEGTGVELQGLEEPMTIFLLEDSLLDQFEPPSDGEPGAGAGRSPR